MTSMEEIMEQKMKEREMLTNNIVFDTDSFYDGHYSIVTGPKKLKSEKQKGGKEKEISNIVYIPRYFLKSGDKQIEIRDTGCLECNPPIITFDNIFDDLHLPNTVDIIMLKVVINKKEFTYPFVYKNEFISKRKYDERFEGLDIPNSLRTETRFCKWTILNGRVKNMPTDDSYRYITFEIQGDKLVFRQAKFRMIKDALYKEQYGHLQAKN